MMMATAVAEDDTNGWSSHSPECHRAASLESTTEIPSNQTKTRWKITGYALRGEVTIPLYSLIFLLAIVGNLLVVIVLVQNKRMRTVTNVFLVNLSVSDLLLAVFCMPFTLIPTLMQDFVFGMAMCILIRYMQGVSVGVCVFTLVAISLERYFAICQPLRSRAWQTMSHSYRTIGVVWALSLGLMLPTAVFQRLVELQNGAHKCVEVWEDRTFEKFYTVLLDLVLLVVPLVLMLCAYGFIAATLFKGLRLTAHAQRQTPELLRSLPAEETDETDDDTVRYVVTAIHNAPRDHHHHHHPPHRQSSRSWLRQPLGSGGGGGGTGASGPDRTANLSVSTVRARRRSVKMLIAVVLEFFLCWTPMYVMQTWLIFDRAGAVRSISAMAMNLVHLLAFVSSCCNPITYCFMSKRFRQSFLTVFYNACCPSSSSRKRDKEVLYLRCKCSQHLRSRTWQSGCSVHRAVSNHRTTEF